MCIFIRNYCLIDRLDGMERSFIVLSRRQTGAKVDNTSPEKQMASSLPHGLFLAAHHVLVDSRLGDGSRAEGRKQRRSKPRTSDPTGVVDLNSRREVMGILLEHTFRAFRLSQLIVGDDGEGSDGSDHMREEGSTKRSRDSGGSGAERGTVTSSLNHSVNANGHVGMVSVDSFGRSVPPPVHRGRGDDESGKTNDADAVEGQRSVVGAWLLAKEACRCLATMVTASPLPLEDDEKNKGATCGVGSKALLTVENVTAIGETLLRSMLSFKHMGCIVSAQVKGILDEVPTLNRPPEIMYRFFLMSTLIARGNRHHLDDADFILHHLDLIPRGNRMHSKQCAKVCSTVRSTMTFYQASHLCGLRSCSESWMVQAKR